MYKVTKISAGIALVVGFVLMAGAVGNADFYGGFQTADFVRIAVGFALFIGACPVIKRIEEEEDA